MPVTPRASALGRTSEKVEERKCAAGMATCQPNQMLLSAAPTRIVPRLEPLGRCERFGMAGGLCCARRAAPARVARRRRFILCLAAERRRSSPARRVCREARRRWALLIVFVDRAGGAKRDVLA